MSLFDIEPESVLLCSAKTGVGVPEILEKVITHFPAPDRHGKLTSMQICCHITKVC